VRRLGFLALALTLTFSACTRVATSQSGGTAGGPESTGARHSWTRPGILRIASLNDPDSLNPLLGSFQVDVDLLMFWAGYLFNYNDQNELVPELATQVPTNENDGISKDGLTITYHLRRGVQWQDGAPLDSGAVVFTLRAVMNPAPSSRARAPPRMDPLASAATSRGLLIGRQEILVRSRSNDDGDTRFVAYNG